MIKLSPKFNFIVLIALSLYSCRKDVVTTANDKETNINVQYDFSIKNAQIQLNPSGNAPLSALVKFTNLYSGYTEIVVKGKHGINSDVIQKFNDNGTSHSIPILGLYPNYVNTVEIFVVNNKNIGIKSTINITTGNLPVNVPNYIHTDVMNLSNMMPGFNMVSGFSGYPTPPSTPYMTDAYGDIRWCLDFSNQPTLKTLFYDCGVAPLKDGNYYFGDIGSKAIWEVDALGKIIDDWPLLGYNFHHNVYEKPNGNFLVTVTNPNSTHTNGTPTIEDYIIEIDRVSKKIINTWDLKQSLNEYRQILGSDPTDWIHCNGVVYDSSDSTIIVSGRVQGVVKLDYANNVKWILGPHLGWGQNRRGQNLDQYLLTPLDASGNAITDTLVTEGYTNATDFEWNWYQHCPTLMPNGDLMVFDNGSNRNYNPNPAHHYSRAVEFKINEANMTVQQIWAYGEQRNEDTFSLIISSVQYDPVSNHVIFFSRL